MPAVDASRDAAARPVTAARAIFDSPHAPLLHEPDGPAECREAVQTLAECFAGAGGTVADIVANARAAAQVLSGDRLQGLSEIVQNADDAGASTVLFLHADDALLAVHDGRPLTLRDVHALAAPWLTTKRGDASATGRFGIGLLTLHSLAAAFELHSGSYHLRLGDPTLTPVEPLPPHPEHKPGDTVLRLPLTDAELSADELLEWSDAWDDSGLLFLRSVRQVTFAAAGAVRALRLNTADLSPITTVCGGAPTTVRRRRSTAPDGRSWLVHLADARSPGGLRRAHKKTSETTPVGVALPLHETSRHGSLYAGLPVVPTRLPMNANAQFDPIASRQDFADSDWNAALTHLISDLWTGALLDVFAFDAAAAWRLVPLPQHDAPGPAAPGRAGVIHQLETAVSSRARDAVPPAARLPLDDGTTSGLAELAVESADVTDLITPEETARLSGVPHALPAAVRDPSGQWRAVLAHWRHAGHDLPPEVDIADALPLAEETQRAIPATVALVAAGVASGHQHALGDLRCLVLADGNRIRPPRDELRVLVSDEGGLGAALGVAERLHPAYSDGTAAADTVRDWLRDTRALAEAAGDLPVLELLARGGGRGAALPRTLTDPQVRALRDALEPLGHAEWERLGAGIGAAVRLDAVAYDESGRAQPTAASPKHAYQPKSIDREPDSFAVAADTAPGLVWIAPRYASVLRSPLGRAGLGAQRFLRLLGAETAPRLQPHPRLNNRYADPRRGLNISLGGAPPERADALRDLQATWSLDDKESPDLDRVLRHIAADRKATRRRRRAAAALAVLSRAWPPLGEHAQVPAAHAYNGWQVQGSVRAWWLWSAGSIPWLDSAAASPTPPSRLRRRTAATLAVHGNSSAAFVHPAFASARSDVLAALGVAGEPETRELLRRLEQLRDSGRPDDATGSDAAIAYQALSERARERRKGPGHVAAPKLRQAFSAGSGLILTNLGWRPPAEALRGEPVFGDLRPFVPRAPGAEPLWTALQVRAPDLKDCVDVMRDLARRPCASVDTQTIALDVLRLMVRLIAAAPPDDRLVGRMRRVPLATTQGWAGPRPVYCVEDPSLAAGIGTRLPVWQPGGELAQFRPLVRPLQLTELTAADVPLIEASDSFVDDAATSLLRDAAALLREDLARNDPATEQAAGSAWELLAALEVRVADTLRVSLEPVTGKLETVTVDARLDASAAVLYLTDPEHLGRPHSGGRAVAGLFPGDRRLLSQAWLAAVTAAGEGREGLRLRLAAERAAAGEEAVRNAMEARLAQLQKDAGDRAGSRTPPPSRTRPGASPGRPSGADLAARSSGTEADGSAGQAGNVAAARRRVLVDPQALELLNPQGELVPAMSKPPPRTPPADGGGNRRRADSGLPAPKAGGAAPQARSATRDYSDLDKETLGLDLVRWVLASDERAIVDLRAQHRVGADAVDELRRFYELKVYAGNEPDEIVLEDSEIRRALSTPDFFVVVVSGVEGVNATPRVRVIVSPLSQLRMSERSQIRFAGVRQSQSLVFNMRTKSAPEA